jgi:23S rRNA (uracil1939-C5)-methyltransferase/tRNA (uracil-5-)-methyltransferase
VPQKFVPHPFSYREEKTLRVESLTNRGLGVCRTTIQKEDESASVNDNTSSSDNKWVIFVPNVIPGELVRLRIYRNFNNYSEADLLEVVEASEDRIEPTCTLSQVCGGCQYQHMKIEKQREWKTLHVQQGLEKVGGFSQPNVAPTIGTEHVFHYRSKITPHYDRPKRIAESVYEIGPIGFQEQSSRRLVNVAHCPIATHEINERLSVLVREKRQDALEGRLKRPKMGSTLLLRHAREGVVTDPTERVTARVSGIHFRFLAGNFFQNNPHVLPVMVDHVVTAATKPSRNNNNGGGGTKMTHLIDCYCGSGLFCLTAASSFQVLVGIEVVDKAVEEARENAALNEIQNCAFVAASAEAIFESNEPVLLPSLQREACLVSDFPRDETVVVVDPPRKGCSPEFLDQLYKFGPQRIVYMSCDPATQARDARGIVEHGYEITSIQPFDLFPQTRHIESLIVFERI